MAIEKSTGLYINHQWLPAEGEAFSTKNPSTGETLWSGNAATIAQIDEAVQAARAAFPAWALLSIDDRIGCLQEFISIVEKNHTDLAEIISKETGKPLWEASTEVSTIISKLPISVAAYHDRTGFHVKTTYDIQQITRHKPQGVLVVLGPYNFPGHLPNGHIIPALLAGNTIVFKPSELTPLTAQTIINYWHMAKLPAGIINLLQGDKKVGENLANHPDIDGILFTGSYATGKRLHQQFADFPQKILALEMGGNNPLVITNINNIEAAVYHTIQSAFITAGQRCTCARRLIMVNNKVNQQFLRCLVKITQQLKVGYYDDQPEPFMGPVISSTVAQFIINKQEQLRQNGGEILVESQFLEENTGLISPGIIDMTASKHIVDEEIFGPLLQVIWVGDLSEAITVANQTQYGLVAAIFSDNEAEYLEFYAKMRAGIINWNRPTIGATSMAPFGGLGCSGNHRPSGYYAADYCAHPIASNESTSLVLPDVLLPGIEL